MDWRPCIANKTIVIVIVFIEAILLSYHSFPREDLTTTLPQFEYRHSSDDEMLSADDIESTYTDTGEDMEAFEAVSFDAPGGYRSP